MTEHRIDFEPLLALATPQLYQSNSFRVLGIPVNATSKDVQRRDNRRKMQEKLGISPSEDQGGPFYLKPPPTDEDIRAAKDRLNDPARRILDEVLCPSGELACNVVRVML